MWSFLYLAGYVGRLDRGDRVTDFDSLVRANRAREADRRNGPAIPRRRGASTLAPHLRVVRFSAEDPN